MSEIPLPGLWTELCRNSGHKRLTEIRGVIFCNCGIEYVLKSSPAGQRIMADRREVELKRLRAEIRSFGW